jgi:hypothetical protein
MTPDISTTDSVHFGQTPVLKDLDVTTNKPKPEVTLRYADHHTAHVVPIGDNALTSKPLATITAFRRTQPLITTCNRVRW